VLRTAAQAASERPRAGFTLDEVRAGYACTPPAAGSDWVCGPDPSAAGSKAIANGHALAAVAGTDALRDGHAQASTTAHSGRRVAMAAAPANVHRGDRDEGRWPTCSAWAAAAARHCRAGRRARRARAPERPVQMPLILFDDDPNFEKGNAFCAAALQRGVYLHPRHNMFLCGAWGEGD